METRLGVALWSQATTWSDFEAAARRVEELGYDQLWTLDHLYAVFGDAYQPIFEGYATLAAWAGVTSRVRLGLLVGANTFRNPAVVAKMLTTIDHVSGGRVIAGLGGAWHELEHTATGLDFGTGFGQRLDWLDEAAGALRAMFDGEAVTSPVGGHYAFAAFRLLPLPVQRHLPILIGGSGERRTLRTVARHADAWNAMGSAEFLRHKVDVLRRHCDDLGRDPAEIEHTAGCKPVIRSTEAEARKAWEGQMAHNRTRMSEVIHNDTFWVGTPDQVAERMIELKLLGFHRFLAEMAAPFDDETLARWIEEVRPMVDAGS
jgi:alkanesulfonate monooxygenase SsuD/methylene tetrahydromethanopterin reductase-like flavin-dependent oxidoreductase (luciferase family)